MLPGFHCNRRIGALCAFRFHFWRPEVSAGFACAGLGRPLLSKPVLIMLVPDPELGPSEERSFVDDFVSCWGKRGAYRLL